jgi:hypothetical protein
MTDKSGLLTDIVYLNKGLITPMQSKEQLDGNHIKVALDQMTTAESRKARRKFRKLHRQACKRQHKKLEKYRSRRRWEEWGARPILNKTARSEYVTREQAKLSNAYGEKGTRPSIGQARNRRRTVFEILRGGDSIYNDSF